MSARPVLKPLHWLPPTYRDLVSLPRDVQHTVGVALMMAQAGGRHPSTKILKGFKGAGVLEVIEDYGGNTYRAVYTVRFAQAVYVLHVYQKKSTKGIETPKHIIDVIRSRLKSAERDHQMRRKGK